MFHTEKRELGTLTAMDFILPVSNDDYKHVHCLDFVRSRVLIFDSTKNSTVRERTSFSSLTMTENDDIQSKPARK